MWTPVYFVLQAKSTEPSWVKQKGQRVYLRILRLKANCQVFGRQMSSQCFEGILTRYSTCPNKHATSLWILCSSLLCGKMTTGKGQTSILDKSFLYRRSTERSAVWKYTNLLLFPQLSPPNSFLWGLHRKLEFLEYTKIRLRDSGLHNKSE